MRTIIVEILKWNDKGVYTNKGHVSHLKRGSCQLVKPLKIAQTWNSAYSMILKKSVLALRNKNY